MNNVTLENWIEALRSGRYEWTSEYLRCDGGYCALGVLADLLDPYGWEQDEDYDEGEWLWMESDSYLPNDVWDDLGYPFSQSEVVTLSDRYLDHDRTAQELERLRRTKRALELFSFGTVTTST